MLIRRARLPLVHMVLIGLLPSVIKKFIYRMRGYRIGKNVSIGAGAAIVGKDVVIGDNTTFGFFAVVRGNTIRVGSYVSIGATRHS